MYIKHIATRYRRTLTMVHDLIMVNFILYGPIEEIEHIPL